MWLSLNQLYTHDERESRLMDWRDSSVVKSSSCSSRRAGLSSQHPHGGSQVSIAPVPGDLRLCSSSLILLTTQSAVYKGCNFSGAFYLVKFHR